MSEEQETKPDKEEPQEPIKEDKSETVIPIDMPELDKMEKDDLKDTVKQLQEAIVKLSSQNKQLATEFTKLQKEKEDSIKQSILKQLEQAGYKTEPFESLSLEALEATAQALSDTDKEFFVPIPKEHAENDMKSKLSEPEAWDPVKKKMVPWSEFRYGVTEDKAD